MKPKEKEWLKPKEKDFPDGAYQMNSEGIFFKKVTLIRLKNQNN